MKSAPIAGNQSSFEILQLFDIWRYQKLVILFFSSVVTLKLDSHVPENFSQIKIFPSHVRKNTIICLFVVWK